MTTSRRNFLRLAVGVPAPPRASPPAAAPARPRPAPAAAPAAAAAAGGATYWFLTGQPGQAIRRHRQAVQHGEPRAPRSRRRRSRTTPTRRRSRPRSAPARARRSSGAGAAAACKSYVDADQVEDLTAWFGAERRRSRTGCSRPRSARRRSTARSTRCRPRRSSRSSCTTTRRSSRRSASQPPQSWDDIMDLVPKFNAQGHRAVLPRRPVALDQHDVAGVPLRPHRRPRGVPDRLRRQEGRLVRPGRRSRR